MTAPSPSARQVYFSVALIAVPGLLWSAYEMYILTLDGAQMLFFSVAHGNGGIMLLVVVGILSSLVWLLLSIAALVHSGYRSNIGISSAGHRLQMLTVGGHLLLLSTYDSWSYSGARIATCIVGMLLTASMLTLLVTHSLKIRS